MQFADSWRSPAVWELPFGVKVEATKFRSLSESSQPLVSHSLDKRRSLPWPLSFLLRECMRATAPFCQDSQMIVLCRPGNSVESRLAEHLSPPHGNLQESHINTRSTRESRWMGGYSLDDNRVRKRSSQKLDNKKLLLRSWQTWTLWVGCQCCAVCADHGPAQRAAARWSAVFALFLFTDICTSGWITVQQ